jgi:hypothetical protein
MSNPNPPEYGKCTDSASAAAQGVKLVEVVLRYEVQVGGRTVERRVRVDPNDCEGVLWTGNATADVTKYRVLGRLARSCWRPGSGRPAWLKILQQRVAPGVAGGQTPEPAPGIAPEQEPLRSATFALSAETEPSDDGWDELPIDSGNCYYHNGRIICC